MKNTDSNQTPKEEIKFSQEQFDMLIRCSEKKDITEWNEWRDDNPGVDILLNDTIYHNRYLEEANLTFAQINGSEFTSTNLKKNNSIKCSSEKRSIL